MRIGIFDPFPGKTTVGIQTYARKIIKHLSKLTPLLVYTFDPEAFQDQNVEIRKIRYSIFNSHLKRLIWEQIFFPFVIRKDKIDLLFMPLPEVPIFINIPTIAVIHDLIPLKMSKHHSFKSKLFFLIGLKTLSKAKVLIADSNNTLKDIKSIKMFQNRKNIKVIHGGVEAPAKLEETTKYNHFEPYILYVGGFAPHKNISVLLHAYHKLSKTIPHHLILVGWGTPNQIKSIKNIIKFLNLDERIIILQSIPEHELSWLYINCDCFIFPSLCEGFGLPVLEAMAYGTPVICSNATSLPEIGGEAVIYFNPFSEEELINCVKKVLFDTKLRNELKQKALKRSKLFTWENTSEKIIEFINYMQPCVNYQAQL
jgi:hypothetical protein